MIYWMKAGYLQVKLWSEDILIWVIRAVQTAHYSKKPLALQLRTKLMEYGTHSCRQSRYHRLYPTDLERFPHQWVSQVTD